ncbi:MAG TPA: hypothetical protein VKP69_24750, partial [Isosphaeraceae bacterium]|nr:hypothetical protein [Isosphaeraceae bacterium]
MSLEGLGGRAVSVAGAGHRTIVLDADQESAALGVCERHDFLVDLSVGKLPTIGLELLVEGLAARDDLFHPVQVHFI